MSLTDPVPNSVVRLFPVSSAFGIGGTFQPPLATLTQNGDNPANGTVCWTPGCDYANDTVLLIVAGRDTNDCPGYNIVFDTTYVIVGDISPPTLTHTLPNGTQADTMFIDPNTQACVTYTGIDPDALDTLIIQPAAGQLPPPAGPLTFGFTGTNPVNGPMVLDAPLCACRDDF